MITVSKSMCCKLRVILKLACEQNNYFLADRWKNSN